MHSATQDREAKALTASAAGLILLDAQNRIVYNNPEALSILTYIGRDENTPLDSLPRMLQCLLQSGKPPSHRTYAMDFQSGRRRYTSRSFVLAHSSGKPAQAVNGVLLERIAPSFVGVSALAQQFGLTQREQETVGLLTLGLTSKEIASRMNISPNTVKAFFRLVMTKMAVSTRSGIVGKIVRMQSPA